MSMIRDGAIEPPDPTDPLADDQLGVDELAARRHDLSRVSQALTRLAPRDAALVDLRYREELTFQQIAAALRITPSRACQLLWRAVERLRGQLDAMISDAA